MFNPAMRNPQRHPIATPVPIGIGRRFFPNFARLLPKQAFDRVFELLR
jgi:hypothetical protein